MMMISQWQQFISGVELKTLLRELVVFPTWILYRTLLQIVLRKDHPWRVMPKVNLQVWALCAKPFLIEFGLVFWMGSLGLLYGLSFLFREYLRG